MMDGNHVKKMLLGGAALFGLLLIAGVPLQSALTYAVVLACPLMMVVMMTGGHGEHGAGKGHGQSPASRDDSDPHSGSPHAH